MVSRPEVLVGSDARGPGRFATPRTDEPAASSAWALLRQPNFGVYFAGMFLSNVGTWVQSIAAALYVHRLTGSNLQVGLVTFAQFAATMVLTPWTGAIADRYDRRRLLIVTQVASSAASALLALVVWLDVGGVGAVFACTLLLGVATAFFTPAVKSLFPLLVAPANVRLAVGLDSATYNSSRAVGPVIGAGLVATVGFGASFLFNAISYFAFAAALLVLRPRAQTRGPAGAARLRQYLDILRAHPPLVALLVFTAGLSISTDPPGTLGPAFATDVYGLPDTMAGWLLGGFGLGAVLAAFLVVRQTRTPYRWIAVMLGLQAVGSLVFAGSTSLAVGIGGMVLAGLGFLAGQTGASTELQSVDDSIRGRVMAMWSIAFIGTRPIAAVVDGALADRFGVHWAATVLALPVLAAAILAGVIHLRRERPGAVEGAAPGPALGDGAQAGL